MQAQFYVEAEMHNTFNSTINFDVSCLVVYLRDDKKTVHDPLYFTLLYQFFWFKHFGSNILVFL